jgi:adenosylhomocysteinase
VQVHAGIEHDDHSMANTPVMSAPRACRTEPGSVPTGSLVTKIAPVEGRAESADGVLLDRVERGNPASGQRSAVVEVRVASENIGGLLRQAAEALQVASGGSPDGFRSTDGDLSRDTVVCLARGARARLRIGRPGAAGSRPADAVSVTATLDEPGGLRSDEAAAVVEAVHRIPLTELEWSELVGQMPLTHGLPSHLPATCLAGVAPVFTVHHMSDFLVMVDATRRMGVPADAITVLDKGYRYRHAARVDGHLRAAGVAVWPWTDAVGALADHVGRARRLGRSGMLVDDGGYTLPVLLDHRPDLVGDFVGLVEQTTSGITKLERFGSDLPLPVFSVAESRLKATIESYGVADAAIRNLLHLLPHEKFEGQPALVLGFGRIGEQIAEILRDRRMRVAVYDDAIVRLVAAHERGFMTDRSLSRLLRHHQPLLVFGSTGRTSLRGDHVRSLRRDTYLVSTTSRAGEFALDELLEEAHTVTDAGLLGTRLHIRQEAAWPPGRDGPAGTDHAGSSGTCGSIVVTVVGDGFPINFHYAESMPNKYADLVLAAMLVGLATLAQPFGGQAGGPTGAEITAGERRFAPGHNVASSDRVLESCGLLERYYDRFGPGGIS